MGQAKARGSKEQRVSEAVGRARIDNIAAQAKYMAERKSVPRGSSKSRLSTMLAVASIGMTLR